MKMKSLNRVHPSHWFLATALAAVAVGSAFAGGGSLTSGNLAVVRVGDGAAALGSASTAVFVLEYNTSGVASGPNIALPIAAAGANKPFTNSGTATSEGFITLSSNGQYLVLAGYAVAPGTAAVATSLSATVNRAVARIKISDNSVDTSTAVDMYSAGNARSATTDDGTRFWVSGTASPAANGGVRYISSVGGTTSDQVATAPTNTRVLSIFNNGTINQLYLSSASSTFHGVSEVGSGIPTSGFPVTITILPGFPTATGPSSYDFYMANPTTIYVADDRTQANGGGIQKWTLNAGTWSLAYTLVSGITTGCRGLTGFVNGSGNAVLFATTTETTNNKLVTVTDTGVASAISQLTTSGANTAFRGLRYLPVPTTPPCVPDIAPPGGNHTVNTDDLLAVINAWGLCPLPCRPHCAADIAPPGGNCRVDVDDLLAVINGWGACPP